MKQTVTIALILVIFSSLAFAQKPQLTYSDETGKSIQINPTSFNQILIRAIGHDNKEHEYSGVLLSDILTQAGTLLGERSKKQTISRYVLLKAKDNYQCIFALAEIDPLFTSNKIILADKIDGKPLSAENGPFQLIAPFEKKHGRWIRQVISIEVRTVK